MESITKLFGDLCEAHIVSVSTKVHLNKRKSSKKISRKSLKKIAYNTLFANLFLDETRKVPQSSFSRLPVKNKMLMLSFNLRVAGLSLEADRLEQLVEELEKSTCLPFTEITSILDFLIQLAGTGPPHCSPLKKDYFLNNKYVGRNTKYQGYDYYDVSIFEADVQAFIANEELQCNDTIQKTLQIMEAAPGTGLPMVELFSQNCSMGDRYERETRVSLFGALIHSRTCDMDIKLDLPPVPDNADLSGLAIKVPQSIDPSEDEGFQSASNLTPDSQSEPSVTPDLDLWEAALTYGPSKRRCWERIGFPPGKKEEPYLSEAGREAFDKFCRLREQELQLFSSTKFQFPQRVLVKEPEIVKDVLNVLIGVVSTSFSFNQAVQIFVVKQGIYVSGTSPESMNCLLSEVAEYGTYYTRLSRFSVQPVLDSSYKKGLVFQAFTSGLRKYLHYYRACVLSTPLTLTLLTISFLFRKLGRQLRYLAELCGIGTTAVGAGGGTSASFPTGVELLSYLYQETLNNCSSEHYPVLLSLLKTSCEPYTRFIHDWVYSGVFRDVYGEFMIQVNEDYLGFRDKHYWTHGYVLISKEVEDCVPVFLKHIANDVYICGKTINLLKLCCPRHYICWSDIPVPRISVTFSLDELKEIEKDCAVYVGRMERIARYSTISKEEKVLRMEIEKQRLIAHAQEAASKALKAITDQQISEKMALDVKKREQFQKLKEQFVKDEERRRTLKQEEIDDDFSYARELREREKRLKALEEDLEKRARQELIDHYTKLSEDAARREKKALWKIQRHKLEAARLDFLLKDQKNIEDMLEKLPGGKYRKKVNIIPEDQSQQVMLAVGQRRDAHLQPDHQKIMDMERDTKSELTNYISKDQSSELTQPLNVQPTDSMESVVSIRSSQPTERKGKLRKNEHYINISVEKNILMSTFLFHQVEEPEKSTSLSVVTQQTTVSEVIVSENQEGGSTSVAIWKKEEADYLQALSNQYCLEKYQDQYEFMSELPVSHLLHHMIPRSYTFPVDPTIQSATDETAVQLSELLSLPVLMKRSITTPLVSHVSLVNKAIVDYYFVELNVEKHFEALRHFLLMEDGEFAQSLSDLLFEKLGTGQTPGELLNPLVLNSILNKALQYSLHGDSHLASNLSFALKYLPDMFKPNAPDALTCLDLRYKVDWPLNIVITENCMNKYNKIFSFLLQLKHMVWTLKDVWFHLKRTALVKHASNSVQFRQLQLYKHEMQHFVKVIQGYIANQILHVSWCEFGNKLSSVGNLEEIYRTHAEYLNKAIFRGLLTEKAAPVMNIIHSIFSLILKFRSQLISQSWNFDSSKHVAVHPNFGLMQQSYNTFKYYSHFLFNVVTKLINRGYQPHLEDFLLRINFNNYYKDN
ncbi:gamma-tubulin complex component 6 [Notechis scutatus]|uniref:Gamma-tubulin complex component 6 n=1 Tax=Notechis scutatus TaxID=8663 RepID=A0A6J1U374_9SAUR|nr:gamma-tubulin complex component 6 [Notechis scutatus]